MSALNVRLFLLSSRTKDGSLGRCIFDESHDIYNAQIGSPMSIMLYAYSVLDSDTQCVSMCFNFELSQLVRPVYSWQYSHML